MLIQNVCKHCGLTRKAVGYYEAQGLVAPKILDNGYRDFSEEDVQRLQKIAILRTLGLSVEDIRQVLAGSTTLGKISARQGLEADVQREKQKLLQLLAETGDWQSAFIQTERLNKQLSVLTRLLDKFPGVFGRYALAHFAPFLREPLSTDTQQQAFDTIINFLDQVDIQIPADLQAAVEAHATLSKEEMETMSQSVRQAAENPSAS